MDLMFPLVAGFGNSLDLVSNLNSSRSDWVLVYATSTLSVLQQKDMFNKWTFTAGPIHRFEAPHGARTPNNLHVAALKVDCDCEVNEECIINLVACPTNVPQPTSSRTLQ